MPFVFQLLPFVFESSSITSEKYALEIYGGFRKFFPLFLIFQIAVLPNRLSVLERYVEDFLHLLSQKAASLISYVEARSYVIFSLSSLAFLSAFQSRP